MKFKIVIYLSA